MDGNNGMNFDPVTGQPLNAAQPGVQPVYAQPVVQPVYAQPVYAQPQPQVNVNVQAPAYQQAPQKTVVFPGREIVGLLFGIGSLISGLVALLTWFPVYGWIGGGINAVFGIVYAIVAKSQWAKVKKEATSYTGKIKAGNGMATAGLIMSILGIVTAIIVGIILVVIVGLGAVGSLGSSGAVQDIMNSF
ncbi:MAG: hypothetical protein IKP92_09735 [Lachnospiraceae bacterium]|nr:hypothetical protein [Lachnospiraceae bacterium]